MEVLTEAPRTSSFTALAEHLSTTPASFYTGPPVLHYYSDRCKLLVLESELSTTPALAALVSKAASQLPNGSASNQAVNGDADEVDDQKTIEDVDVWVTSDKLLVYSTPAQTGLSIPYPSISLHAIQSLPLPDAADTGSQGLYMQIMNPSQTGNSNNEDDDDLDSVSITIIPTASGAPVSAAATVGTTDEAIETEDIPESTPVQAMFAALSNCSNLHPDPIQDEDEDGGGSGNGAVIGFGDDGLPGSEFYRMGLVQPGVNDGSGGLPPPMPGSGGWITAENMHEYFNEQGEYIGPSGEDEQDEMEPLGPGAGHARPADDNSDDDDETKWRRTE